MEATEELRQAEWSALADNQFISHVSGKNKKMKGLGKLKGGLGATAFIVLMIIIAAILLSTGNLVPEAISERLVEETDVQYADAVESKKLVFQQAMREGTIPEDTAELLKARGVIVGYMDDGKFVEGNQSESGLVLKINNEIITPTEFINKINDPALYKAFEAATYSRAAYYYDEAAEKVFREIGTTRNNYTKNAEFETVLQNAMGSGSNVDVNTISLVEKTRENNNGETEVYYAYEENGADAKSEATDFINAVNDKNQATTTEEATLYSASALNVADAISKEQKSSLFYLLFMENISKMKAGEGSDSKINDALNFLYRKAETEVVDIKTGEVMKVTGSPLESPSLYAVLSGNKVAAEAVEDYASDRIIRTVEDQLGKISGETAIKNTVVSSGAKLSGAVGRLIKNSDAGSSVATLEKVAPTINKSLVNNSYESLVGIDAGEFLVEGAVNVGKQLAKASGGAAGDAEAVQKYARLNSAVLAMDAAADREGRSPFDITSKNTFLGSIVHKLATLSSRTTGALAGMKILSQMTGSAALSLLPSSYADATESYLSTYGVCETYGTIGAVGTAGCSEISTFDPSTLDDPFNNPEFISFVEENTILDAAGNRKIKEGPSILKNYIIYNNERKTPLGVPDGGALISLREGTEKINYNSDITKLVENFTGVNEEENRIITGAAFLNSANNPDWKFYKFAQRYVSLARAVTALKQYSNDKTAYNNLEFFEGQEDPVMAFLNEYYAIANQ